MFCYVVFFNGANAIFAINADFIRHLEICCLFVLKGRELCSGLKQQFNNAYSVEVLYAAALVYSFYIVLHIAI